MASPEQLEQHFFQMLRDSPGFFQRVASFVSSFAYDNPRSPSPIPEGSPQEPIIIPLDRESVSASATLPHSVPTGALVQSVPPGFDPEMDCETAQASARDSSSSSSEEEGEFQVVGKRSRKSSKKSSKTLKTAEGVPSKVSQPKPSTPKATPAGVKLPPPIFIRAKSKWPEISSKCNVSKINFLSASNTSQGVRVQVPTSTDFRNLTSLLAARAVEYHTYALEEERKLRVVIKGIPKEISVDDVKADLISQSFPIIKVSRLFSHRNGRTYDMVHVTLDDTPAGKAIYGVKAVCGLSGLVIQPPNKTGIPTQCHRCQLYGHSATHCFAQPRCVKCLGDHGTIDCTRPKKGEDRPTEPPACVLCKAKGLKEVGHTANYRGCPIAPRANPKAVQRAQRASQPTGKPKPPPPVSDIAQFPEIRSNPTISPSLAPIPQAESASPTLSQIVARTSPKVPQTYSKATKAPKKAPLPTPKAPQAVSHNFPSSLDESLALVADFTAQIDFNAVVEFADLIRKNQGNGVGLLSVYARFSPLIQRLGNYQIKH